MYHPPPPKKKTTVDVFFLSRGRFLFISFSEKKPSWNHLFLGNCWKNATSKRDSLLNYLTDLVGTSIDFSRVSLVQIAEILGG